MAEMNLLLARNRFYKNNIFLVALSIFLGVVFVLSGFVKAVDPVGFSYKIEGYLRMFGWTEWNGAAVVFAVVLCAAEMILGLLLLSGLWRRSAAVAVFLFVVLAFVVPLYACLYLPPFDFLPYGEGSKVERGGDLRWYDAGFNDVMEKMFAEGKPVYMVGMRSAMPPEAERRKQVVFFGVLAVMLFLLFYGRKKLLK